jgi:hypothetical protein
VGIACVFAFSALYAADPVAITAIAGDGQIAEFGTAFPLALAVRVVDATGAPVAGVPVSFDVVHCSGGTICLEPSAYPVFEGSASTITATTDANGEAESVPLFAGSVPGYMGVVATAYSGTSPVAQANFDVRQTESLDAVPITAAFSGAWYDPAQSGHGLLVEVLPDNRLLAYWFAFTPGGEHQAWFGGVGAIVGNQAIVSADRGQGGDWVGAFDPAHYSLAPWGTLTFTFSDCNHGRVDFFTSSEWGTYYMELTRLTQLAGLSCP